MSEGLVHLTQYKIEDSNIALLGSDLEKRVREHAGDKEPAWANSGKEPGLQIWRIEKFHVVEWPKERKGTFYDGDSYIILHTYKQTPDADKLSYDLHFWLGENTSQDEAGTAAYKTVELDDHLEGLPVQYREVQGQESARFLSYFPHMITQHGGVDTGFHHVTSLPEPDTHRLYHISQSPPHAVAQGHSAGAHFVTREVPATAESLAKGHVFLLDRGTAVWQLNTKSSTGKERFKAAEFSRSLADGRMAHGHCDIKVFEEAGHGVGSFLSALGADVIPPKAAASARAAQPSRALYKLTDPSGSPLFEALPPPTGTASLDSGDVYLLDAHLAPHTGVYVWVGKDANLKEQRLAMQYAQKYLHDQQQQGDAPHPGVSIAVMREGREAHEFVEVLQYEASA